MSQHSWKFFRAGGVDQAVVERGADLEHLHTLDLKLWIAVAMPVKGTALDEKTARLLDVDGDERIRSADLLATVDWLKPRLKSLDVLFTADDGVELDDLADEALRRSATRVASEHEAGSKRLTLAAVEGAEKRFTASKFNGDGVITEKTAERDDERALVAEILATHGSVADRSGDPGIDADKLKAFYVDVEALRAYRAEGASAAVERPLGAATDAGFDLLTALTPKLEDYFARVRLASFDERAQASVAGAEADWQALGAAVLGTSAAEVKKLPLAKVAPNQPLPLEGAVNPGYAADLLALRDTVLRPLLGASTQTLSEADFRKVLARFASFAAHRAKKPATKLDGLTDARLTEVLADGLRGRLEALVEADAAEKGELDRINELDKLVRLRRDFVRIVRNFVSFSEFYGRKGALFQVGTLYLDGRACALCVEVTDAAKHATLAGLAGSYLAYCEIRKKDKPTRTIVAAFTAGDSDNLMVGRNGVFFDRDGKDWDATITKIVDNPISIRQAFFSPYKKFVRLVEEMIAKRASDADAEAQAKVTTAAQETANADRAGVAAAAAPAPAAPPRRPFDVGTIAALGVAIGGIGAMVTGLVGAFFGLGVFMPLGVLAIILMISGPSMMLAYLKLRRRNLGPLLDASGWAINALAAVNVPFGGALTELAKLPANATRSLHDPYAEEASPVKRYVVVAILLFTAVLWTMGKLDRFLPRAAKSTRVFSSQTQR